jgi:hypothetical protein
VWRPVVISLQLQDEQLISARYLHNFSTGNIVANNYSSGNISVASRIMPGHRHTHHVLLT